MNNDRRDLELLAIFHYVLGGIIAVVALFPIIHFLVGLFFLMSPEMETDNPKDVEEVRVVGWFFVGISSFIMLSESNTIPNSGESQSTRPDHSTSSSHLTASLFFAGCATTWVIFAIARSFSKGTPFFVMRSSEAGKIVTPEPTTVIAATAWARLAS